ncbi:MAG: post-COAP-1 domain-containing protein [Acidobacteriota bacterium]
MMVSRRTKDVVVACVSVVAVFAVPLSLSAREPVRNPSNGHYYLRVDTAGINWSAAEAAAEATTFQGIRGHLATITSAQEDQFVASLFSDLALGTTWLGGFQPPGSVEPAGGWHWITGEPWNYSNWAPWGEPSNGDGREDVLGMYLGFEWAEGHGKWNDFWAEATGSWMGPFSYVVEFDTAGDQAPVVSNLTASPNPQQVNAPVILTATLTDTDFTGLASWQYTIEGGAPTVFNVSGTTVPVSAPLTFSMPGVYSTCGRATDVAGNVSAEECLYVVVFNPDGGFVTGGGWIMSPAGAYRENPSLTGKATFGFVSKYQKGATVPGGDTQFQFHAAGMKFQSTAYEWLVIAGARAQYKGSGTINGAGTYQFLLTAIDGDLPGGGGTDRFRIKIWGAGGMVYDNQMGADDQSDPTTGLGGGSIVIHRP